MNIHSWLVAACLGVAVLYAFIYPGRRRHQGRRPDGFWPQFVLRWFHSITWGLLAGALALESKPLGALALTIYATFVLALITARDRADRR